MPGRIPSICERRNDRVGGAIVYLGASESGGGSVTTFSFRPATPNLIAQMFEGAVGVFCNAS